uniref:NADH-ubiquinone oxidoreductase chain 2 n=1 Tax=Oryctes rhinoceros TaxID=72550 RepID=A0A7D4XNZ6_ORYRH|nr:NADH dehydrogenase subunit 2 [Oryctes rhinoceros]QKX48641.1 NADH dehydrogenase subunit 2 [Oryctes rhinoceros]QSZ78102.1 NADH dehydrogenase subunit 2 [Oryctes rhinoceros]WAT94172.1 NADH dehydrogenase subunit 2 [Oryctes rhinoceros]WAT94185.1 NADH dehydrogenase subunit 2 [Oryctes rhinoceros]WAT94198.1 NADH dehydrogenase subunit 2 [Oryctes rhinoceros]
MYYKILFYSTLMIGSLISVSSYSWMGMWIGLEINLLSMIPLMSSSDNMMASEASLKYFVTQALASSVLLLSIVLMSMNNMHNINSLHYFSLIFNSALLTKMGAAPFHFWFPEVIEGLSWPNALIMLTWQKLAPMALIMFSNNSFLYLILAIIFSMSVSGIMGLNQTSLRKIMAYSSINHIGWMLASMMLMETIWIMYFTIYTIITINIVSIFYLFNVFYMNQLYITMNYNLTFKFFFILNFMSLGGLPPFLGFAPKWMTIHLLTESSMYFIAFMMVVMTLMTLYFYLRIMFSTILLSKTYIGYYKHSHMKNNMLMMINALSIMGLMFSTFMFNMI